MLDMKSNLGVHGLLVSFFIAITTAPAQAYVGPGAGMGLISAFFALIAVVAMSLFMILLYPIKALLKKHRGEKQEENSALPPMETTTEEKKEDTAPQP